MNMNKKILSLMLVLTMVLSTFTISLADSGNEKVNWLVDKEYVLGDGAGNLNLDSKITRAEVAAIVARIQGLEEASDLLKFVESKFTDMNSSNISWARGYVNAIENSGIVNGYLDGTFRPTNNITYEEVIKMMVMVNGDIPELQDTDYWASPYIAKAIEVGILEDIGNIVYTDQATRDKIFEMAYNILVKRVDAELEGYKAIVVDNKRTAGLGENEVDVVILEIGANEDPGDLRYQAENRTRVKLEKGSHNSEDLLGKVVDIKIDENNKVESINIDKSYEYHLDSIAINEKEIKIGSSGESYFVFLKNRYKNSIERIQGVFYNDKAYDYNDFLEEHGKLNSDKKLEYSLDLARVTTKGTKTYFIDSYDIQDVGAVAQVDKDLNIYIYDDAKNADLHKYKLDKAIGYKDGQFESIDIEDIFKNDIIHIYGKNRAIVMQEPLSYGEFTKVLEDVRGYYVRIDGKSYSVLEETLKMPIYSLDGESFYSLNPKDAVEALDKLRNKEVSFLLDINGNLQMISGDLVFNELVVAIEEVNRRNIDIIDGKNMKRNFKEELYSELYFADEDFKKQLNNFQRGDILYLFNDGNSIEKMFRIASGDQINKDAKAVVKNSKGKFDIRIAENIDGYTTITLADLGIIDIEDNTNIFIANKDKTNITNLKATSLKEIVDTVDNKSMLRAYVITGKDINDMKLGNEKKVENTNLLAHTLIFTDFKLDENLRDEEYIKMSYSYNPTRDDEIIGQDSKENQVRYKLDQYTNIPKLLYGDIVKVTFTDLDKTRVKEIEILIEKNAEEFEVTEIGPRWVKVKDSKGKIKEHILSMDYILFGRYLNTGDMISINIDKDNVIHIIDIR